MLTEKSPFFTGQAASLKAMAAGNSALYQPESQAALKLVCRSCRRQLLDQVMPFWEQRVIDPETPGLFHYFDRAGNLTATDKSTWCQGRMAYTFSLLALEAAVPEVRRQAWQEAAASARRLLTGAAYAGNGRWHYLCTRYGAVKQNDKSAFSDIFALMGLSTWALLSGEERDVPLIQLGLSTLTENLRHPGFAEFHHFSLDPAYHWHGPAMAALGLVPLGRALLGDDAVRPLADWALERILWQCANDDLEMLLEMTDPQGRMVESEAGATTNPGHALESMWFCLEEALYRGSEQIRNRCLQIIRWAFTKGYDNEFGGLFAFVSPEGGPPPGREEVAFKDRWDDKLWWVQAEAIYTLGLAAALSDDFFYLHSLQRLHDWTMNHLPDRQYGEWHLSLSRKGHPDKTVKGNVFRSAFHVPRALLKTARLEDMTAAATPSSGGSDLNPGLDPKSQSRSE